MLRLNVGALGCGSLGEGGEDVRAWLADFPRQLPVWMVGILALHFLGLELHLGVPHFRRRSNHVSYRFPQLEMNRFLQTLEVSTSRFLPQEAYLSCPEWFSSPRENLPS